MLENGFIKLHRRILKWEWYDEPNTMRLFIHLLLTVNLHPDTWHGIQIPRGARVSSYAKLAKELHLTNRQIRTALSHLEETGEVTRQTYPNYTVFSISKYDEYQTARQSERSQNDTLDDGAPTRHRQQNKKVKESQEDKEDRTASSGANAPSSAPREKSIYERMRE